MKTMEATSVVTSRRARRALVAAVGATLAVLCWMVLSLNGARRTSAASAAPPAPVLQASRRFACGQLSCDPAETYCETINTDVPELPSNYACRPLPTTCRPGANGAARDCGCFPPRTRGDYCSTRIENGVQIFYRTSVGGH